MELVDSLDSGSSVHYGRAGSSPASPTKKTVERLSLFLLADPWQKLCVPLKGMVFPKDRHFLFGCRYLYLLISIAIYLQKSGRRMGGEIKIYYYFLLRDLGKHDCYNHYSRARSKHCSPWSARSAKKPGEGSKDGREDTMDVYGNRESAVPALQEDFLSKALVKKIRL